jgi:flagellar motor switch protein FliN/FliY
MGGVSGLCVNFDGRAADEANESVRSIPLIIALLASARARSMTSSTAKITYEIHAAVTREATQLGQLLTGALDREITVAVGEPVSLDPAAIPESLRGPGLTIVFQHADAGIVLMLPEATGLLPDWYSAPDTTGRKRLDTLAQAVGSLLLPDELAEGECRSRPMHNLAAGLARGEIVGTSSIPLQLTAEGQSGVMHLVCPVGRPADVLAEPPADSGADTATTGDDSAAGTEAVSKFDAGPPSPDWARRPRDTEGFEALPSYARSLLKIELPLSVTLASARKPVGQIVRLRPGSILQFSKSCDQPLELRVGDQLVAEGEAVKVHDKFGIRITSMVLPGERFSTVPSPRAFLSDAAPAKE